MNKSEGHATSRGERTTLCGFVLITKRNVLSPHRISSRRAPMTNRMGAEQMETRIDGGPPLTGLLEKGETTLFLLNELHSKIRFVVRGDEDLRSRRDVSKGDADDETRARRM